MLELSGIGQLPDGSSFKGHVSQGKAHNSFFLLETKNSEVMVRRIQCRLHFPNSFIVDPRGLAGGIVLFWTNQVTLDVFRSTPDYIDMLYNDFQDDWTMRITCIHALYVYHTRQLFWDELREISYANTFPWLCIGDFNDVLYPWEKFGKKPADRNRMLSFRALINDCSIMELPNKGCKFTWMKNHMGDELVKECLDRAMCSMEWRLLFPAAKVFVLPAIGSDHSPLIINSSASYKASKKFFTFEVFWNEDKECSELISKAWNSVRVNGTCLISKL